MGGGFTTKITHITYVGNHCCFTGRQPCAPLAGAYDGNNTVVATQTAKKKHAKYIKYVFAARNVCHSHVCRTKYMSNMFFPRKLFAKYVWDANAEENQKICQIWLCRARYMSTRLPDILKICLPFVCSNTFACRMKKSNMTEHTAAAASAAAAAAAPAKGAHCRSVKQQ